MSMQSSHVGLITMFDIKSRVLQQSHLRFSIPNNSNNNTIKDLKTSALELFEVLKIGDFRPFAQWLIKGGFPSSPGPLLTSNPAIADSTSENVNKPD
jgi:hypothetical protein